MIEFLLDDLIWQHRTTSKDVIEKTGLSSSTVSRLRNNQSKNISTNTINALCKYFNCEVSDLIAYIPD